MRHGLIVKMAQTRRNDSSQLAYFQGSLLMTPSPLERWHALVAQRDATALPALLADDVIFYSPVLQAPQVGQPLTVRYLTAAMTVLGNASFRYVRQIVGPQEAMLEFVVELDGVAVNGVDLLRWNEAGLIVEFKVMLRPLRAIHIVSRRMLATLERIAERER